MPITLSKIRSDHDQAGAVNERIAPCAFVSDSAALTKRGDLFTVLRLAGVDAECLDPEEVASISHRFDGAMRALDSDYRVYQYLIKRDSPEIPLPGGVTLCNQTKFPSGAQQNEHKNECREDLAGARALFMEGRRSQLCSIELYLVILRLRPLQERLKASFLDQFSVRRSLRMSREDLRREVEQLQMTAEGLSVQLAGTVKPTILDNRDTVHFLRRLANLTPWKADVFGTTPENNIDQYIANSDLHCWPRHLKQDDYYIKLMSLIGTPGGRIEDTDIYAPGYRVLRGLMSIPCNMIACSQWRRNPNALTRKSIDTKREHYHNAKTRMRAFFFNRNPLPHEILIDDSKTEVVKELNAALTEMENERFFGRYALTVSLFHEDLHELQRAVSKVNEVFATHDARIVEESYNMVNAWAGMIPGNYMYVHESRQPWMLNTTYADMSFLFAPSEGSRWNYHLQRPSVSVLETREQTPYYFTSHFEDVGHMSILGANGAGKSFLTNSLISDYQQYDPYTVILDLGGSYRALTAHYGGSYLHIGQEDSHVSINPFLPPTKENRKFVFSFVRFLIERDGEPLSVKQREDLGRKIEWLYVLDEDCWTLSTLARTCCKSYASRLNEWVGDGRLAGYFDNAVDNLTLAQFQAFDFEGMEKSEVLEPLLFYILHRASINVYDAAAASRPKLMVLDEAWKFFTNPITGKYVHEAFKTWRKRNAAVWFATQSADDLRKSGLLPTIAENCFTKLFLASPGLDVAAYCEMFKLNKAEAEIISRLVPKQEFLVHRPDGSKVLKLFVDPKSYEVFSNATGRPL